MFSQKVISQIRDKITYSSYFTLGDVNLTIHENIDQANSSNTVSISAEILLTSLTFRNLDSAKVCCPEVELDMAVKTAVAVCGNMELYNTTLHTSR